MTPTQPRELAAVVWELTLACNMRCVHCGSSAGVARGDELSPDEALAVARDLVAMRANRVTLMGGEPFLRADWARIARTLADGGVIVEILTNGLLVDAAMARAIMDAGVHSVSLSVDGLERTHDGLRARRGSFRAALDAVRHLRAAGLPVGAVTQVNRRNLDELEGLRQALIGAGVQGWQLQLSEAMGRCRDDLMIAPADLVVIERFVVEAAADGSLWTYAADCIGYMSRDEPRLRTQADGRHGVFLGCQAGIRVLGITSHGHVRACLSLPDTFDDGDLRERPLADIWRDPGAFAFNRGPRDLTGNCAGCPFGKVCRGGCSSLAWASTGRLGDQPYCLFRIRAGHRDMT